MRKIAKKVLKACKEEIALSRRVRIINSQKKVDIQKKDFYALGTIMATIIGAYAAWFLPDEGFRIGIIVISTLLGGSYGFSRFNDHFQRPGLGRKGVTRGSSTLFMLVTLVGTWMENGGTELDLGMMGAIGLVISFNVFSIAFTDKDSTSVTYNDIPFEPDIARKLAPFADQAYKPKNSWTMPTGWEQPRLIESDRTIKEFQNVDTQVIITADKDNREIVVAFRGTEWKKWDILTDVKFWATGLSYENKRFQRYFSLTRVHSGFLKAYRSVREQVFEEVNNKIREMELPADQKIPVFVTGHSLGGGLATLCALDLAMNPQKMNKQAVETIMYNFGGPRVGTRRFVKRYLKLVPNCWRIVNDGDPVPYVPPRLNFLKFWLGYRHIPHSQEVKKGGKITPRINEPHEPSHSIKDLGDLVSAFVGQPVSDLVNIGLNLMTGGGSKHAMPTYCKRLNVACP